MTKAGVRDLRDVEQSLQSLAVTGEVEVEAEKQSMLSIATESRFLEDQSVAAQFPQLSVEEKLIDSIDVEGCSRGSRSEQDQSSGQQQANHLRMEDYQLTWGDKSWQQDSWNSSSEENQQSAGVQGWPTEAASFPENASSSSETSSGWDLRPGDASYVDLGYFDLDIDILGITRPVRVAYTAKGVEDWIKEYSDEDPLFGIDIEWRPNHFKGEDNKAALFQIAGKHGCLIVQLLYIDRIPHALKELLANPNVKLAGVGVRADTRKLFQDYGLKCGGEVDLGLHAADVLNRRDLKRAGLATLCEFVLGIPFKKNKSLTVSNWAVEGLSMAQITYAASDACIAYSLLVNLNATMKERLPAMSPHSSLPRV